MTFEGHRGRLVGLAYRMLGSRGDAEDAVQDAWVKWAGADRTAVQNEEAFLTTIVTRLCLDRLKSARAKREVYVGPWLPEPVMDADALSPHAATELADDLSFALLLALERLSPLERAAFLLHDVFDAPFAEVARTLDRSEAAVRQLAARARKAVRSEKPTHVVADAEHKRLLDAFVQAAAAGDASRIAALLRDDVVALTDGGGKKIAALNPVRGADHVSRFFAGLVRKYLAQAGRVALEPAQINGAPGYVLIVDGALDQALTISVADGKIAAIYTVRNPDKLRGLVH